LVAYDSLIGATNNRLQATRILRTLIRYVKALQKDRIHLMNRYRHQLQTSRADAEANRAQMTDHLATADHQLTTALHMLDRLGRYKDKIMKQIGRFAFRITVLLNHNQKRSEISELRRE